MTDNPAALALISTGNAMQAIFVLAILVNKVRRTDPSQLFHLRFTLACGAALLTTSAIASFWPWWQQLDVLAALKLVTGFAWGGAFVESDTRLRVAQLDRQRAHSAEVATHGSG